MRATRLAIASSLSLATSIVSGFPFNVEKTSRCAAVNGSFSIDNYKLYPENLDWDPVHCKLYISANFNSTVLVYDPYTATYDILSFEGITGTDPYHVSGIDYDSSTGSILISANSGSPFVTSGQNMTGSNKVIRWDTNANSAAYTADLAEFSAKLAIGNVTGGGYQDFAVDKEGNTYVPVVFHVPGIAKISEAGEVSSWYLGQPSTSSKYIYLGIVYHENSNKLVITAPYLGTFVTFDVSAASPVPTNVTMNGWPSDGSYSASNLECDGLLNPARYSRNVLLCSENGLQAITLWASRDGFASVEYIGQVADNSTADIATWASPTATVEIGDSIYVSHEYFHDLNEFDVAGNRSSFPFVDVTAELDALVSASGYNIIQL
ncbi:tri14-like protein [Colletotrichum karsti]|uniref:Tri14-like protein n=1 Tax=Colletotrichum karsti TaxID=1095194 RepID=A0A9P6LJH7_9PEZI|nr:tri14-like protein [Colletotrichum karsti]KAF9875236.1 tri14-like protein [Colletotrichum karsti]